MTLGLMQIIHWIEAYILFGGLIPVLALFLCGMYFKGYLNSKKIAAETEEFGWSITSQDFSVSTGLFNLFNKAMDKIIGGSLGLLSKYVWEPIFGFVDGLVSDSFLRKVVSKLGADLSFKKRVEIARVKFDESKNAFWWNKTRAPDFRSVSPVISGKWFNGEPVENYVSFLVSPKTFFASLKTGIIVFAISFAVLALLYKPQAVFGFMPSSVKNDLIASTAEMINNDPSIVPEFRHDVWSQDERKSELAKAADGADSYAESVVDSVDGYDYYKFGFLFKGGILTDLFLALAIGSAFARKSYRRSYSLLKIPYVKDSHEVFGYEKKMMAIEAYKMNLSAANLRATGFDRASPLVYSYKSSGALEHKGQIGARRKYQPICQSVLDKSQNTALYGATGTGKSRSAIQPEAQAWFEMKNVFYKHEKAYNELFDTRLGRLTQKAIDKGYLDSYCPLPKNPVVIAMTIMDIKSQLWKDLKPYAEKLYLGDDFIIIGADEETGQYSVDLLAGLDSAKVRSMFSSVTTQMGGKVEEDFWVGSALQWIQRFADIAMLFHRTKKGAEFMEKKMMKVWSLSFLHEIIVHDANSELLAHAIYSIYVECGNSPERLSDILTLEKIKSIEAVLTEWQTLAEETKSGIKANMNFIMAGYNNSKLAPFMTGLGNNQIEIGDLWKYITAFDLDVDKYQMSGKMILLMAKTLIFEEAVKRQIKFSRRAIEISDEFRKAYPNVLTVDSPIELIPVSWYERDESLKLLDEYLDCVGEVSRNLSDEPWEPGTYNRRLAEIRKSFPETPDLSDLKSPYTAEILALVERALEIGRRIRASEPRFAQNQLALADLDPAILSVKPEDSEEVRLRKREHLALYYEYQDAKSRVAREHMLFLGDEYQELITVDKSGGCYSDYNFPNISRSTNFKYFVATQTLNAYILKIGKEAADNFMNQMRSQIYLVSEDSATREYVSKLAGNADIFQNPYQGQKLKDNGKETDFVIYDNFNAFVSNWVEINKNRKNTGIDGSKYAKETPYPYDYDVFAAGEPLEADMSKQDFSGVFSGIFDKKAEFYIPSMKRHFLDESGIPQFKRTGSDSQGTNDNAEAIQSAWKQAKQTMEDKYQSFLREGYQKDTPLLSDSDYTEQGNIHAFVNIQRAGMTIKDHVIISQSGDYMAAD